MVRKVDLIRRCTCPNCGKEKKVYRAKKSDKFPHKVKCTECEIFYDTKGLLKPY